MYGVQVSGKEYKAVATRCREGVNIVKYIKPQYSPKRTQAEKDYYRLIADQVRQVREAATHKPPESAERKTDK